MAGIARAKAQKREKITTLRTVWANDLVVTIEGEQVAPHFGEWVSIYPFGTVSETVLNQMGAKARLGQEVDGDRYFAHLLTVLRHRVRAWNWTDNDGEPLPQPKDDPDVFFRLEPWETGWLMGAINGWAGEANERETPLVDESDSTSPSTTQTTTGPSGQPSGSSRASAKSSAARPRKR